MTRELHHEVTLTQTPTPDDEGNGMQAIIRAFIKNPVAAGEIIMLIAGGVGLYWGLTYKVDSAAAASEQHYKDLTSDMTRSVERLSSKLDMLAASDASEIQDIKNLYARGDTRWNEFNTKINGIEVRFTKSEDKLDYITHVIEGKSYTPHDQRGEIGPRPSYAEGR